jgi:hypothetical protein
MFALDEFKLGGVSPTNLDRLVQEVGGFESFLQIFQEDGGQLHPWQCKLLTQNLTKILCNEIVD